MHFVKAYFLRWTVCLCLIGTAAFAQTPAGDGSPATAIEGDWLVESRDAVIRIQREGLTPPGLLGVAPAERCADAVMRALQTGEPEIIVSTKPLRVMLAAEMLWPALSERVLAKTGVTEFFRQLSARRGRL